MYFMCIPNFGHAHTNEMHVVHTWQKSSCVFFPQKTYFDSLYNSVVSEIKVLFLFLILKNDLCLKKGTLKLF